MMKLLKYDFKRNGAILLGMAAVLFLVQISMMLFVKRIEIQLIVSILAYVIAGVMLFTTTIRTYSHNIKSYQRKLLPVHSFKTIVSPLIMGSTCLLILGIVSVIHGYVSLSIHGETQVISDFINKYSTDTILALLSAIWMMIYILITIFLAITIAASIRLKGSFWIGIVVFFLIVNGIQWIEHRMFGDYTGGFFNILPDEPTTLANGITITTTNGDYGGFIGAFIFELVCSVAFLYIMVRLIDRKVEV